MRLLPTISIYGYMGGRQIYALRAFEWAWQTFLGQSIGIDETNTFQLKFFIQHENCGRHRLRRLVGVRVGVAYSHNKLALRTRLRNLNLKSEFSIFDSYRDIRVHMCDFLKFVGGLWALKWAWPIR